VVFVAVVHLLPGGLARLPSRIRSVLRATSEGAPAQKEDRRS
jgi:branched-chain amino acid transport system permease protein